ncbi:alpha/beta hydrolase family protein [Labilithrix luteola]|uniref:alpha/beta hydrolase family protein n=1 Tax=Labilithrix luteola TaxID=1391654 RepID=UPI00147621F2|nr:prolyl oligopeptidase family serine peptidase [Labilithrix luteola]
MNRDAVGAAGLVVAAALSFVACTPRSKQAVAAEAKPASSSQASKPAEPSRAPSLTDARRGFTTRVVDPQPREDAAPSPPKGVLELVKYPSSNGLLSAYVSPATADASRRPAIVWIPGGFSNGIDEGAWEDAPPENDQTARAFREEGIVLFIPSLRGGNDNPGRREFLLGEVDDVLAAADYVSKLPHVDPTRVFLGGHSTGGTLALLVAQSSTRFRAVFAFGPVADVYGYSDEIPSLADEDEAFVRSPIHFMATIRTPTFILEGAEQPSNARVLPKLAKAAKGAPVTGFAVKGADHFSVLAPLTRAIARQIVVDDGKAPFDLK